MFREIEKIVGTERKYLFERVAGMGIFVGAGNRHSVIAKKQLKD
jgi:hypothetical protein